MIRRLISRFVQEQDGIALVIAIAAMSVLAIATAGVVVAGTANEGNAWASTQGRSAFQVAQQALAYGEGLVYADVAGGTDPTTDDPNTGNPYQLPTQPNGATGSYTLSTTDDITWQVVATGSTSAGLSRTVSAYVTPTQTVTTEQLAIWNYLYEASNNPNSVSGGAVINMPILTGGDFGAAGATTKILGNLEVGHNLTTSGNAQIGSASSPIGKLEVLGTCAVNGPAKPAGTNPCDGSHNLTYAKTVGSTLDTAVDMPTVDFTAAYDAFTALTQTGCPAGLFDSAPGPGPPPPPPPGGDAPNNSDNTIGNVMFGNTDYNCTVGTNTISWNHTTKILTANGEFYFDGTLTPPGGIGNVVYHGLASFYFTGGVTWNTGTLCGIAGCGTGWDTAHNVLFMVANCQGSPGSGCVSISSANTTVQFGVYSTKDYQVSGQAGNMGPVICNTFTITGGSDILIPIQDFPPGTPAPTTSVSYTGTPPTGWSG